MPTLMLHALIALLSPLHRGSWGVTPRRIIRDIAYTQAMLRWAQMCADPVEAFAPAT
ncbi:MULTISPECIES: hypothetical protein [unclassified Rhodococcus (in: high G+C Gram-positive bacteria)]|uniref:hypothetical protein n=1 Tax=unclassified Rhodococcus (in: high G+C Gram-positive bacteria) TaxID=192944 RepID=UPI00163B3FAF|nr:MULTISPECIES: hypothetical protein [unclassified Rhodococcus (in: high G+C Gram-positive bacteria)]MBC2637882.1 hypothetical protein [Rhodococcus sp. 3A]MBC2897370.1 hypothetical protein [Rhodococcus sp. 4CII]